MVFFTRSSHVPIGEMEVLLQAHLDVMYRVALRYTRDASRAQDLVQDTVVRCLRFRSKYTPGTHFRAWALTILTNVFRQQYRRAKCEKEWIEREAHGEDLNGDLHPEYVFFDGLLGDEVTHALDGLGDDHRSVIVLCDLEGMSYKDASDILDIPIGTVMSRLYRARRMIRAQLLPLAVERGLVRADHAEAEKNSNVLPMRRVAMREEAS